MWKYRKIFQANGNWKKSGVDIFISDKITLSQKTVTRQRTSLYKDKIMIKGLIHQENLTIVNIDALNIRVPEDIKWI